MTPDFCPIGHLLALRGPRCPAHCGHGDHGCRSHVRHAPSRPCHNCLLPILHYGPHEFVGPCRRSAYPSAPSPAQGLPGEGVEA